MYLIRGVRLCYTCITGDPLYIPMLVDDMDVGRKWYAKHTSVVGVPGVYSPVPVAMEARAVLVDRLAVKASGWPEGLDWRGSLFWPEADDRFSRDPVRFMAVAEVPYLSFRGREAAWGRLCAQCVDLVSGGPPNFLCYDRFTEEGLQKHLDLEHI